MKNKDEIPDLRVENWEKRIWCDRNIGNMSGTWGQTPDVWKNDMNIQEYVRADIVKRLEREKAELVEALDDCIETMLIFEAQDTEIYTIAKDLLQKHKEA